MGRDITTLLNEVERGGIQLENLVFLFEQVHETQENEN